MAKRFQLLPIMTIDEVPIKVPVFENGEVVIEEIINRAVTVDGKTYVIQDPIPKSKDGTLADIIEILIRQFPRERTTIDNITHATRLKSQVIESRRSNNGTLTIEEAEHDWLKKMLNDEHVGPKIFQMNLLQVTHALDDFERPHESKEIAKGK